MQKLILPWQDPLDLAQKIASEYCDEDWIFLYSALNKKVKNSFSYIALFPGAKVVSDNFFSTKKILQNDDRKWFGYFSYELAQDFEKLLKSEKSFIHLPKIYLVNFKLVFEFDHDKKTLTANFLEEKNLQEALRFKSETKRNFEQIFAIKKITSNFSDESYLAAIADIKKMIAEGDFYQTNLTRKFFGNFSKKLEEKEGFELFCRLIEINPANYFSFFSFGKNLVISSSPELFLEAKNGLIISRPIKGTTPRDEDKKQDLSNKNHLKNSIKEKAENLMIVDLVRNDLSRICQAGSVEVKNLFKINSYQNVHHLSSEIHGKILPQMGIFDVLTSCFPPGSMTGAPKIKAMEAAAEKEKVSRGIYSGALGFFSGDKDFTAKFSVVIRTLILNENKFEFQVGGAITFDSDAKAELEEIFNKAKGLIKLLGIVDSVNSCL